MASKKVVSKKKIVKKSEVKDLKKTSKKAPVKPAIDDIEEKDEETEISSSKVKKPLEIDAADMLPEVEEKVIEEEVAILSTDDEDSEESGGLDPDDLNPFGDKWEE
jgi:hypothetical protein